MELPAWMSVDRVAADQSLYAYARLENMKGWHPGAHGAVLELLPHPGTLTQPVMKPAVDLEQAGDWDYYPTYDAYLGVMEQFGTDYPELCQVFSIGQSAEGREIMMAVITSDAVAAGTKPRALYTSSIHGDETAGYVLFLRLIHHLLDQYGTDPAITGLVDNLEIWINPLANPDGTYAGGNNSVYGATRFNANGVDLNRNYPDPEDGEHPDGYAWQPETMVFMDLAGQVPFVMSLNCHGGAEVFNYPWDTWSKLHADDNWWYFVGREWADTVHAHSPSGYFNDFNNGVTNGYQWYSISGGRQDYMNYFHHCREVTLEISNTKLLPADQLPAFWEYNHRSFLNYLGQARYGLKGRVVDAASGDPLPATIYLEDHDLDNSWVVTNEEGWFFRPLYGGTCDVTFFSPGYGVLTLDNVNTENYSLTELSIALEFTGSGLAETGLRQVFTLAGNPGPGPFALTYHGIEPLPAHVLVTDASGRTVVRREARFEPGAGLDLQIGEPGFYFLYISSGREAATYKLVKE